MRPRAYRVNLAGNSFHSTPGNCLSPDNSLRGAALGYDLLPVLSSLSSGWPSFPVLVEIHRSGTEGEWGRDEGLGDGKLKLQTQVGEGGRQA